MIQENLMGPGGNQNLFPPPDQPFSCGGDSENIPARPPPNKMKFPPSESFPLPLSASPFPEPPALSPVLSAGSQIEFKAGVKSEPGSRPAGDESLLGAPKPLESLYETSVPPFLSKTYDLVDDPSFDSIISWGEKGDSFVVSEPVEFARTILPRNFKHNNFSSFVRQLNTYGFRKIDTDKWEFTNIGFIRGQRHRLKKIQRRNSPQSQQIGSSSLSCNEAGKAAWEGEIEHLKKERSLMMQEIVEMQHQQRGTIQHMEVVKNKLEAAEKRQKQMVSFLARMFQKPAFLVRLHQMREQKSITSSRSMRKFVKHRPYEPGTSSSSPKGQIVKYQPELCNFTTPFVTPYSDPDELGMVHELLHTQEDESVLTLGAIDPLLKRKDEMSPRPQSTNEYLMYLAEDLSMHKSIPEFSTAGTESASEDVWNIGFEPDAGTSSSTTEPLGNLSNCNVSELGFSSGLSDIWDIGSLQPGGSSGIERWLDEESPFN